jgi:intraflagellar transport protein 52
LYVEVFPPAFRDLPVPSLELFDLEEAFGSERTRLAQLANKCMTLSPDSRPIAESTADLEYFILEAGIILNVRTNPEDSAAILYNILDVIVEFKKSL